MDGLRIYTPEELARMSGEELAGMELDQLVASYARIYLARNCILCLPPQEKGNRQKEFRLYQHQLARLEGEFIRKKIPRPNLGLPFKR